MHLENHRHQPAIYIKKKNKDFPNSLLQPFNFQASAGDAPIAEATTESKEESESEEDSPPAEEDKEEKEKKRNRGGTEYRRRISSGKG
ncbi:hypothetical protein CISIN_1g034681mg [Citrus sinensis]|uniref:Uncharacterized protein n=1 Tax=Citrus sinensis TaxID=2711 RepID=A0A067D9M2_CITSI|nr:hypothetical protein CISIN_1g034681mg [Citrus sinensis]